MQYTNLVWRDGQPYSEMFDDIYYSMDDDESISGEAEFRHVFFKHNGLPERWQERSDFVIAELGFGSGLNCLLTIREWLKHCADTGEDKTLHYIAIEKYPLSPQSILQLLSGYPELQLYRDEVLNNYPPAVATTHTRYLFDNKVAVHFRFMDVRDALEDDSMKVDAWYLDGFSPAKNPGMWSCELFARIYQNSIPGTTCSTYTAAGQVRRNLQEAGFTVTKVAGYGKKRDMLTALLVEKKDTPLKYADKPWLSPPSKLSIKHKKATVLGAGIAGLTVAYALVKRGWSVKLIDRHGSVAKETSANPVAMVYPRLSINNDIDTEFYTAAYCYAINFLRGLQKECDEKFWFNCGLQQLWDKDKFDRLIDKFQFNDGFISQQAKQDNLCKTTADGTTFVEYESAGMVLPVALCTAVRQACGDAVKLVHADVSEIKWQGDRWQSVSDKTVVDETEVLIVAGGSDISALLPLSNLPVETIRGQVVTMAETLRSKDIDKVINADVYVTPAVNKEHFIGATYTRGSSDPDISQLEVDELIKSLDINMPGVLEYDDYRDSWVGFRAMAKDRVVVAGAVADESFYTEEYNDLQHGRQGKDYKPAQYRRGLYISAAHGSRGFTSSYLCAEIIAAQIAGEPMPVRRRVLDYMSPSRFIVNDLKRR